MNQNTREGNSIENRSSDTEVDMVNTFSDSDNALIKYEIELKDEENKTTLTYTREGELEETTEEDSL